MKRDIAAYRIRLRITNHQVLLVEGSSDKQVFQCLIDEARACGKTCATHIDIDTAESLASPAGKSLGNREKVEQICHELEREDISEKIVGFVDREFRDFDLSPRIRDRVNGHHVSGRLVWSRGHSVENYFFTFQTIRQALRAVAVTDGFDIALSRFEMLFDSGLIAACALSLAALDTGKLSVAESAIKPDLLEIRDDYATVSVQHLEDALSRRGVDAISATKIRERYRYWSDTLAATSPQVLRWLCHGHIGLKVLWSIFALCVRDATGNSQSMAKVSRASDSVKLNACADAWARLSFSGSALIPDPVLEMLRVA